MICDGIEIARTGEGCGEKGSAGEEEDTLVEYEHV
jgi:hypothetical protein